MQLKSFVVVVVMLLMLISCRKSNDIVPASIDFSYFPLRVTDEYIYSVETIHIDAPINVYDTQRYYLKEYIESTYTDNLGKPAYRMERYQRSDTTAAWNLTDVWMSQYYGNQAHKVEENIRYIKLVFPASKNLSWNGNGFNTLGTQYYSIDSINVPWNGYDSTCLVMQQKSVSLIDKYWNYERYAKHIGLVEKVSIQISQAYIIQNLPIEQRIERGDMYRQELISFKN
jgi:hypothetical protein